jgi:hypothetical protein
VTASGHHRRAPRAVPYGRWLRVHTELFIAYAEARRAREDPQLIERLRRAWRDHEETWPMEGHHR